MNDGQRIGSTSLMLPTGKIKYTSTFTGFVPFLNIQCRKNIYTVPKINCNPHEILDKYKNIKLFCDLGKISSDFKKFFNEIQFLEIN